MARYPYDRLYGFRRHSTIAKDARRVVEESAALYIRLVQLDM